MKLYLLLACVAFSMHGFAQDSTKIEQYCELVAYKKLLSNKVTIDVEFGEKRKLFDTKDYRIKDENGKVKQFNSFVDAINYMGNIGWKLVNAFLVTESGNNVYHFFFKKEMLVSELEKEN